MMISEERKRELIDAEVDACDAVLVKYAKPEGVKYLSGCTTREFVEHCYANKVGLIEQLGGWRWHGNVMLPELPPDANEITTVYYRVFDKHTGAIGNSVNLISLYDNYEWPRQLMQKLADKAMSIRFANMAKAPYFDKHGSWCNCTLCAPYHSYTETMLQAEREKCGYHFSINVRKGQSVSRAVLAGLEANKASPESMAMWREMFEAMGQLWATNGEQWGVSLSIAPSSFLRLGHYNEGGSCYRFGGERMDSKGIIAQMPRSFVGLFYNEAGELPEGDGARKGKVSGRCWGQLGCAERPGLLMTNVYKITKTRAVKALEGVVREMFGVEAVYSVPLGDTDIGSSAIADSDMVYVNADGYAISISEDMDWLPKWIKRQNDAAIVNNLWVGGTDECSGCHDNHPDLTQCEECGDDFCGDCCFYDEYGSVTYCQDCAHSERCSEPRCYTYGSDRSLTELADGRYACGDHAQECADCSEMLLGSRMQTCEECEELVCESCLAACNECGDAFCSGCMDEHVEACKEREKDEVNREKKKKVEEVKAVIVPVVTSAFVESSWGSINDVVDGCNCTFCTNTRAAAARLQEAEAAARLHLAGGA